MDAGLPAESLQALAGHGRAGLVGQQVNHLHVSAPLIMPGCVCLQHCQHAPALTDLPLDCSYPGIDYQDLSYYSAPKEKEQKGSLDEVDPELLATFERLGVPINEQKRLANVAVDAVFDSKSIATTFKKELQEHGVIFCSISEAVEHHPELVQKYLGSVVRPAALHFLKLPHARPAVHTC